MMRQRGYRAVLCLATLLLLAVSAKGAVLDDAATLLRRVMPDDQPRIIIQLDGIPAIRRGLRDRPILDGVQSFIGVHAFVEQWQALAAHTGVSEGALLDAVLGDRAVLMVGASSDQWVLITHPQREALAALLKRLAAVRELPRHGTAVYRLPEQETVIAVNDSRVVISSTRDQTLFDQIISAQAGRDRGEPAPDPRIGALQRLSSAAGDQRGEPLGRIITLLNHAPPLGGWSAARATVTHDHVLLSITGQYDSPPFEEPLTQQTWSDAALAGFDGRAILAIIEPTDVVAAPGQKGVLERAIGAPIIDTDCGDVRRRLGALRVLTLGEVDGRSETPRSDLLLPAGAMAMQMQRSPLTARQFDRQMRAFAAQIEHRLHATTSLPIDKRFVLARGERAFDLQPALNVVAPDMPLLQGVSLNWDTIELNDCSWCAAATHPQWLEETRRALTKPPAGQPGNRGRWANCGLADGVRLAAMLRTHAAAAEALSEPGDAAPFKATMQVLADLAAGMDTCRWRMSRPCVKSVQVDATIRIAPSRSAR